jgi:nucleotide-binding universal stress UspA family protein
MPGIVVGTDGSAHSQRALEWAVGEAALRHVPLTVITVHEIPAGLRGSGLIYLPDRPMAERARRAAQLDVEKALAELGLPVSVTVLARSGHPAHQTLEAARGADMIVLGSRGAGGFGRLLAGSVGTQVSQHARCPVVIVPPEDRTAEEES